MDYIFVLVVACLITGTIAFPPLQLDDSYKFEESKERPSYSALYAGVRISQDLDPIHYDLRIRPIIHLPLDDPQQFTAPGDVTIRIKVVVPTNNITLHANDMTIYSGNVQVIQKIPLKFI